MHVSCQSLRLRGSARAGHRRCNAIAKIGIHVVPLYQMYETHLLGECTCPCNAFGAGVIVQAAVKPPLQADPDSSPSPAWQRRAHMAWGASWNLQCKWLHT
jgi:hypothetical protein